MRTGPAGSSASAQLRVLLADDSRASRELLAELLRGDAELMVVGAAADGGQAVEMAVRLRPDLIVMDVHMPVMDGLAAAQAIMERAPTRVVMVSAISDPQAIEAGLRSSQTGALTALAKPSMETLASAEDRAAFVSTLRALARVPVVRRRQARPEAAAAAAERGPAWTPRRTPPDGRPAVAVPRVVAIAASTGGPAALRDVLGALPADFPAPVLVVQHISPEFTSALARWLARDCALRVRLAAEGAPLGPGVVYIAAGDRHLGVRRDSVTLLDTPPVGGFRPSATLLFQSVARAFGASAVGVVLTGMGSDGVEGLRELRAADALVIAQDEATSVVYGMPGSAAAAGLASEVLPLGAIGARLARLARLGRKGRD